jgi:hypothetical protein
VAINYFKGAQEGRSSVVALMQAKARGKELNGSFFRFFYYSIYSHHFSQ